MQADTVALAVGQFKMNDKNLLKLLFNNNEFLYDNKVLVECYDTCLCITSKLDTGNVHTVYLEYGLIRGVELIEQS